MKVLEINSVCGIKSTGRICTDLAEVLEEEGFECKIAYGRDTVPEKYHKYAYRIGDDKSVKKDVFKTRFLDNAGFNSVSETRKFIEWVKGFEPDIIHLHNIHGYYINIKILFDFLSSYGKPVIWTLHDCWSFTGHCAHFTMAKCDKWLSGCHSCPQKRTYPSSVILDNSKRNYEMKKALFTQVDNLTLVTPSKWLANLVKSSYLKKYEVVSIPNGIDLSVFRPTYGDFRERYGLENKKIILGAATSWPEGKNLKLFSEVADALDDNYKVVVVGVPQKQAEQFSKKLLTIPRTHNVEEMAEIYTSADVFANLSMEETMGLTTVEAMACGTPVITSNCTAVPEVVTVDSGVVIENLTVEDVRLGIEKVLSKKYDKTIEVAKKYEKKQQYKKYIDLYNKILKI